MRTFSGRMVLPTYFFTFALKHIYNKCAPTIDETVDPMLSTSVIREGLNFIPKDVRNGQVRTICSMYNLYPFFLGNLLVRYNFDIGGYFVLIVLRHIHFSLGKWARHVRRI